MNLNRSRIDYFLIKSDQIDKIIKCDTAHALSSTSFDHKKISLTIGKRRGKKDFNKIDTSLLKNRGVNLLVKSKVLESYVVHADPDAVPGFQIRSLLIDIGRIERLIREWIKNNDDLQTIELAEAIFEQLPQLHFFETLPLTSSDDFFFEGMVSAVRTSLLSVQASIHLEKNKALKELSIELSSLKNNYDNNSLQIKNLEQALTDLNESYLRDELDNYKIFDKLNNERLTPFFMKLAKVQNTSPDLSKIKGDTGEDLTENELGKKITDFYADLYSKPTNSITVTEDHIRLGSGKSC
jgi:hypothetical protein